MTSDQLAAIEARLRAATPGPWTNDMREVWTANGTHCICDAYVDEIESGECSDATFIANAPADIAALVDEVKRLREALKQACMCVTCNGAGEIDVVTGYTDNGPNDPIEVYELDECPECAGQKIGSHVEEATARVLEECR